MTDESDLEKSPIVIVSDHFLESDEFDELDAKVQAAARAGAASGHTRYEIDIPNAVVALIAFSEEKRALTEGRDPRPVAAVIQGEFAERLRSIRYELSGSPTGHPFYREVWNRICRETGHLDQIIKDAPIDDDVPF